MELNAKFLQLLLAHNGKNYSENSWVRIAIRITIEI